MAQRPLIVLPQGGQATPSKQRLTDDVFSFGPGSVEHLPPASAGALVVPTEQPKCGFVSVGLGPVEPQPPFSTHHLGGPEFAGQQQPSINYGLHCCLEIIDQFYQQQLHHYPQLHLETVASFESAMAAPPSPFQPVQLFEVRASTWPKQAASSPTEVVSAHRERSLNARSRIGSGQGGRQEGSKTSRITNKGRKQSRNIEPKRRLCEVEPLDVQARLEPNVERDTLNANGKHPGSQVILATVFTPAASGQSQRLTEEFTCDVIGSPKHANVFEVQDVGPDCADDPTSCQIADPSVTKQASGSASDKNRLEQFNQRPASYAIDAVDHQLDQMKHLADVILAEHRECASPAVITRVLNGVIKTKEVCQLGYNFVLQYLQHTPPLFMCVVIAAEPYQLIVSYGRWLDPSGVEAFVNQPPPWPPPEPATSLPTTQPHLPALSLQ